MDNNINVATEISDASFHFTRNSVFSFVETNKWFTGTLYLISHQSLPVSDRNIEIVRSIYPKVEVIDVTGDPIFAKYSTVSNRSNTGAEIYSNLRFTLFNLGLSKVLFFSSSALFFKEVTDILSANEFTATPGLNLFYLARPLDISKYLNSPTLEKYILEQAIPSTIISYKSTEFSDSKFHQLTWKLKDAHHILFETFGTNSTKYFKINQVWLHKNHTVSQNLLKPSSFTEIVSPEIPRDIPTRSRVLLDGISIIIPAYKASEYIEACLDSIRCLTIPTEILVGVDNCDSTLIKLIQIRGKYPNLKIFRTTDSVGPYIIRNSLVDYIKYSNILFFDADDIMKDSLFTMLSTYNNGSSQIRFKYTNFKNDENPVESTDNHSVTAHGVFFIPAGSFKRVGGFQPWICGADTEFIKRCQANRLHIIEINQYVFYRRIHKASLTQNPETTHGSKIRNKHRAWIKQNRDWHIPITKKITLLEKIN